VSRLEVGALNDFGQVDLEQKSIKDRDVSASTIDEFRVERCLFEAVMLNQTNISEGKVVDCIFTKCSFAGAELEDFLFERSEFNSSWMQGIQVPQASFRDCYFNACKLHEVNFRYAKFKDCIFDSCALLEADFLGADFKNVDFINCDLRESQFSQSSLKGVRLKGSQIEGISEQRISGRSHSRHCPSDLFSLSIWDDSRGLKFSVYPKEDMRTFFNENHPIQSEIASDTLP